MGAAGSLGDSQRPEGHGVGQGEGVPRNDALQRYHSRGAVSASIPAFCSSARRGESRRECCASLAFFGTLGLTGKPTQFSATQQPPALLLKRGKTAPLSCSARCAAGLWLCRELSWILWVRTNREASATK